MQYQVISKKKIWIYFKNDIYYVLTYVFFFRENFERAYIEATEQFYNVKAPQQLATEADGAGVFGYMKWAESKLREEEQRALKYLETSVTAIPVPGDLTKKISRFIFI